MKAQQRATVKSFLLNPEQDLPFTLNDMGTTVQGETGELKEMNPVRLADITGKSRWVFPVFLVLAFLIAASPVRAKTIFKNGSMVSVARKRVNMRSGPGRQYLVRWQLDRGVPLLVRGTRGNWVKVRDFERDEGWIHGKLLDRRPHLIVKKTRNKTQRIDIRKGPGSGYELVGQADSGTVFQTLARKKGWAKVRHRSGLTGWVRREKVWGW
ncbi:MAG: SH3 domain-containing protein [Desulfobacterales bacterium]|nr:SH3 domain-containing protein [Desulfobacterales bacterium]